MVCWGQNDYGQTDVPQGIYRSVSAGRDHSCALSESGEVVCWGANGRGQTDAPEGTYRSVDTGNEHNCALRESGEVVCWGGTDPAFKVPTALASPDQPE